MENFIIQNHLGGILLGFCTFLIIGLFHPLVIKGEYYFGTNCKWAFLVGGIISLVACLCVNDFFLQSLLGVTSFSCFWSIKEVEDQKQRVIKGWFPMNPRRRKSYIKNK